jgi:hypothetical protein
MVLYVPVIIKTTYFYLYATVKEMDICLARLLVLLKDLNLELWARQMDQQEQEGSGNHMELLFCTKLTPVELKLVCD